jgi:hypothetical protein
MKAAIGIMTLMLAVFLGAGCKRHDVKNCEEFDFVCKGECGMLDKACTNSKMQKKAKGELRWYSQRAQLLGFHDSLLTLADMLVAKKSITATPEELKVCSDAKNETCAQRIISQKIFRACSPYLKMATEYERKRKDEIDAKAAGLEAEFYESNRYYMFNFAKQLLGVPVPDDLAGKACAYQAVAGLADFPITDGSRDERVKALKAALSPNELKMLEIDPSYMREALAQSFR